MTTEILLNDGAVTVPCDTEVKITDNLGKEPKTWRQRCPRVPCTAVQAIVLGSIVLSLVIACILLDVLKPKKGHDAAYHLALVEKINRQENLTWKAVYNRFASQSSFRSKSGREFLTFEQKEQIEMMKKDYQKDEFAYKATVSDTMEHKKKLEAISDDFPKNFDARSKWPFCTTVHDVRNQGGCGSCWAISAASVISDRICIHSNGTLQPRISTHDIIACCANCSGCHGELMAMNTFLYWREEGIVSGGSYGSYEGCKPYPYSSACGLPCSRQHYLSQESKPKCHKSCQNLYSKSYQEDKYFGASVYDVELIFENTTGWSGLLKKTKVALAEKKNLLKKELMHFGPVHACFNLVEDFQHYKSGVYKKTNYSEGKMVYGHCVKLIGWGQTKGLFYWLGVNSWGRDWGEFGLFKFHEDETPQELLAGLPDTKYS